MNIPNLPTDNLYKFIALTGVLLFVLSVFYPVYQKTKIRDEISIHNGEAKKLDVEREKLKNKQKEIKSQVKILDKKINLDNNSIVSDTLIVRTKIVGGSKELVDLSSQIDKLIEEYLTLKLELDIKTIEINTKLEIVENKKYDLDTIDEASNIFSPASLLLAFVGFLLWYERTQKLQDKVLKQQTNQYLNTELCQSCGMRLTNQPGYYSWTKEDQNSIYCKTCFSDGKFTEPDLTIKDMENKIKSRCKEIGYGKIMTYVLTSKIKDLDRWREKFYWK
ncbi:zinc ribbon domain-containing protein [Draconibacterium orientale]|uniref:zinc ribbon domain-containing protein n=1 Tax=Draconibacterium orientale TaxID=1168034 RepID=UPI002ABE4709|nr:zinc ribbon domain-containing protein [Draconibacterium orientale]